MDYNNIKLEKGMYSVCNKSFTDVLEDLDPSDKYKGTDLDGLDAYQRQLKRFGIKVSGPSCDNVEKFFIASDSAVLFPEFITRSIKQGIYSHDILHSIIAAKSVINTNYYRAIESSPNENRPITHDSISECSEFPEIEIKTKSDTMDLSKHGCVLSSSYESLRFQNLDVLAVILRKIGSDIVNEQLADAITVIEEDVTSVTETAVSVSYSALLSLWSALKPYHMNVMITSYSIASRILALSEMRDSNAGLNFQGTGKDITPVGAKLVCSPLVEDAILGFDKDCTLQMIQSGDIIIDHDKVIDKQLERASVSVTAGFSKIFSDAVKSISISSQS